MNIGLIDVDNHSKKKKWGATIYPNIALGKISAWHKMQGDNVEWAQPMFVHYDRIYVSKIFNFSPDINRLAYSTDEWVFGGTGYDLHSKLPTEIDRLQPDYTLFPNVPKDTAYGFLTRGCPNKCKWCVVPQKEGGGKPYMDIDEIAVDGRHNIVLMDNNILGIPDYARVQLDKIIERGYYIDFNQALDARLVTKEFSTLLASCKWMHSRIRFACDTTAQIKHCDNAMQMILDAGYRGEFFIYTMLHGSFEECYERIMHFWYINRYRRKNHLHGVPYAHAQPYRDPNKPNRKPQWQKDMANWVNKKMLFETVSFDDFQPRKGFVCHQYFNQHNI